MSQKVCTHRRLREKHWSMVLVLAYCNTKVSIKTLGKAEMDMFGTGSEKGERRGRTHPEEGRLVAVRVEVVDVTQLVHCLPL